MGAIDSHEESPVRHFYLGEEGGQNLHTLFA